MENSRFRFRVWDSRFKKWVDPEVVVITASSGLMRGERGGDGHVDHWELVQFTGLADKNGVDIYEGDVVDSWAGNDFPEPYLRTVVVDEKTKQLTLEPSSGFILCDPACSEHFEVIGNIYQHPHLIEAK